MRERGEHGGIFLRALVDTPWLREHLDLCVC